MVNRVDPVAHAFLATVPTQVVVKCWGIVNLILLHGVAGIWDEVACLAIPAMAILGVALAVLRAKPAQDEEDEDANAETSLTSVENSAKESSGGAISTGRAQSER